MILTNHAVARCQQRGISQQIVSLILDHGSSYKANGALSYHLNAATAVHLEKAGMAAKGCATKLLKIYVIADENDVVITACHKTGKRKPHFLHA